MADVPVPPDLGDAAALRTLLAALDAENGNARFVGGWVRDSLLGDPAQDLDLATVFPPAEALARCERAGLPVWSSASGLAHGTVGVVIGGRTVEVTTLRRDVATDGRHATVAFTDDWEADAARRDFTINALSAHPLTGRVFDYFGGLNDLAARRVRFIGSPLTRIAEDHLRILRFFRFQARFGSGAPDADSYAACVARAADLMALSRERIAGELLKLLAVPDPAATVRAMLDGGIFRPVLPEITDGARLAELVAVERAAGIAPDGLRRLASLLPRDPSVAQAIAARLRLSKVDARRLVADAEGPEAEGRGTALAYGVGVDAAVDRLLLAGRAADAAALLTWQRPRFPLTGGVLIARGLAPGPAVARALRAIEQRWVAEDFPGADRLDAIVAELLAGPDDQISAARR